MNLETALNDELYLSHNSGDRYYLKNSGGGSWELVYYPIFACGKSGREYKEPRGLFLQDGWNDDYMDFRECPLRYASRI